MANTTDTYTLTLIDKILAPLRAIEAQASRVAETMGRIEKQTAAGLGFGAWAKKIQECVGQLSMLKDAGSGVVWIFEKMASGVWAFGKSVLSAASFREKYLGMFSHQFGDRAGKKLYDNVLDFAQLTPGTAAELAETTGRFANIGIGGKNLSAAVSASADVQAMFGGEAGAKFGRGITDMWSKRNLELQDFKQSLSGIVGFDVAQAAILRLKGINVAAEKVGETFDKLHKAGKITGREGAIGSFMAVQEKIDRGGALGSYAVKRGAGSLEGLISNIGEAWDNLLRKVDFESMPGIATFKDFLKRILVFFDAATPQGKLLLDVVERLTNTLFGGLSNIKDDDLERFFKAGLSVAERLMVALQRIWELIDKMLHSSWDEVLSSAGGALAEVGNLLGQGIVAGVQAALTPSLSSDRTLTFHPDSEDSGPEHWRRIREATQFRLWPFGSGDSSGQGSGEGPSLRVPAFADGGIVTRPTLALIGEAGPEAVVPLGSGGSSGGESGAAAGASFVDAFFAGVRERAEALRSDLADDVLALFRASAVRSGAPVS